MNDAHMGYRYEPDRYTDVELAHIRRRMVDRLLQEQLSDLLLKQPGKVFAVRLQMSDEYDPTMSYMAPRTVRDLRASLTINQAQTIEIREYVDFRPMGWWELSQTATEEIRRRIRNWWRRPLEVRIWNWQQRMAYFEKKHFGRAFDGRNKKSGAIVGT